MKAAFPNQDSQCHTQGVGFLQGSMIHLTYSNQTERLLDALRANVDAQCASPLEPTHLVVPNGNVETWVKLELARATGIAANLQVRYLRRFVGELIERSQPTGSAIRLIDASRLEGFLLALFHDDAFLADPDLAEVRGYLKAGEGADAIDLRRFQLARQLSVLFDEYTLSRPEMLDGWLRDRSALADDASPSLREVERWQRRLWKALAARAGREWLTLGACFQRVQPAQLELPPALHVFGISYVARVFQQILQVLASRTELYVYTLNPCMEFWEDVQHKAVRDPERFPRRAERGVDLGAPGNEDPFHLESTPGDTPALRLWGRPGRENVRLLNELSDCDFQPLFEDPTAGGLTLLTELQRDILVREPERTLPDPDLPADPSVQILACPGIRREAEILASEIWKLVQADPSLRFNEIGIILPASRKDVYQTHLQAVFQEMYELPHAIVDLPLGAHSRVVEAIELLLALPLGEFGRQELLKLATHPAVMCRFPDATTDEWLGWCDALGIVHGADHQDHADTYIERDILNWDQGMRRLALGGFMSGRGAGPIEDAPTFELGGEAYVPESYPQSSVPSAAGFALLIRSLIADSRFAARAKLALPDWITFLRGLITSVIGAPTDDDERVLGKCLRALQGLEELDLGGREVSYRIPYELAKAALGGLQASRGQYLADGVVVASFVPMRAIPFKVMFLAGLGEGQFPAGSSVDHLDLRLVRPQPGDVGPREKDKYMFLEALLCTRQRLYLSYVSRETLTGDPLAPSSVVVELQQMLERGYRTRQALDERVYRRFPLRRHEDPHTLFASLPAEREERARALGRSLRDQVGPSERLPDLGELRASLAPDAFAALGEQLGLCPPPPLSADAGVQVVRLRISALRKFLECPLQGAARYRLGMRDEADEDLAARADEAFITSRMDLMVGLRSAFLRSLGEGGAVPEDATLVQTYDGFQRRAELVGAMPTGAFGAAERQAHLRVLRGWRALYQDLAKGQPTGARTLRFGGAEEHARVDWLLDPLVLPVEAGGRRFEVRLHGKTETVLAHPVGSLFLINAKMGTRVETTVRNNKECLRAFLDYAVQTAAGIPLAAYSGLIANVDPEKGNHLHEQPFRALDRDHARGWLTGVLEDLLSGPHDYLFPCEAVFQQALKPDSTFVEQIEKLREKDTFYSSKFGPVPNPEQFPAPDEERARTMAARRFGPILDPPAAPARAKARR